MKIHKCDGCKFKAQHQEMGFKPFGVCSKEINLIEAEKAYNAEKCPFEGIGSFIKYHYLTIPKKDFESIIAGERTIDIRKSNIFQIGDIVHYLPIDEECGMIVPHIANKFLITNIHAGGIGFCGLVIERIE